MSEDTRRLAAIMYTDMVGYTALGQRDESLSLAAVEAQQNLLRPVLARHGGREVKTMGDAFLVEFASALEAVRCAYDIQRSVREFNLALPSDKRLHIRIGVHLGEVVEKQGDILGDAVNVASRIEPLADDGGVCLTQQVHDHVHNKLELPLQSIGSRLLKNVSSPVEVYKIVMPWSEAKTASPGQADKKRVAVLPLVNMSGDPNDEFFADGMTEEMISTLSNISGLTVISRTSTMQYKGAKKNLVDIGRELGAGTLLEGSVRKAGNRVRITVQLLDAAEDKHLWAQNYDRDLQDIFAVQSDVAANIADALKVRLFESEAAQISKKPTENTEAYMLYLKGRQYWNMRSKEAVYKAMEYFQLAIDGDPNFALAYAGIADCWNVIENWGYASTAEAVPRMKQALLKALKMDNKLAEAHTTYAMELGWHEWRWDEAELEFKRAIELNPNYATAHQWYAWSVLRMNRRLEEELREASKALELDPLAPIMNHNMGQTYYYREEYDEAIKHFEKALAINPAFLADYLKLAFCYVASSRYDKGIELLEMHMPKFNSEKVTKLMLVWAYGTAGRIEEARRLFAEVEGKERVHPVDYAWAYFGLGDSDKMFEYLDMAMIERGRDGPFALIDPIFLKRYRSDPRFLALKNKVGI
ncbi:MAG: tetratricopeptide repeat protein [Thaumarchaeota archaeon]|nr:tetratricopeptide repeat protein [Nitrososphaerota archaeon]